MNYYTSAAIFALALFGALAFQDWTKSQNVASCNALKAAAIQAKAPIPECTK